MEICRSPAKLLQTNLMHMHHTPVVTLHLSKFVHQAQTCNVHIAMQQLLGTSSRDVLMLVKAKYHSGLPGDLQCSTDHVVCMLGSMFMMQHACCSVEPLFTANVRYHADIPATLDASLYHAILGPVPELVPVVHNLCLRLTSQAGSGTSNTFTCFFFTSFSAALASATEVAAVLLGTAC